MYYVVYHENGKVDIEEVKGRTFIQLAENKGYSLMHLSYYEEVKNKRTRNFRWNGKEKKWMRKYKG